MLDNEFHYINLLSKISLEGKQTDDRTGIGTTSIFGHQMRFDLTESFPLVTTKKLFWKGIVIELLWMLKGETNTKFLHQHGVKIWDEWQDENGELGPVYGKQMRNFGGVDQVKKLIYDIKNSPSSRRLILSMWNPMELHMMALPPCPTLIQFKVYNGVLSAQLYQRSADAFLGLPFDIASYSLLVHLLANECGLKVGELIHTSGDVHIYNNHVDQVNEQLMRDPFDGPKVEINITPGYLMDWIDNRIEMYDWEEISKMITLKEYKYHPPIKAEVAV